MKTKQEIREAIELVLKQVQDASGNEFKKLDDSSKPIGSLPGFDSLTACEAAVLLEVKLGCKFGDDIPFIDTTKRKRARTMSEAIARCEAALTAVAA